MKKVNLREKFALVDRPWQPHIVGAINDQLVKIAKFEGEYIWHSHEHEDEMFLVVRGHVDLHTRDSLVQLKAGEFCVVPKGVEHMPSSPDGADVMLIELASTRNTGSQNHELTIEPDDVPRL